MFSRPKIDVPKKDVRHVFSRPEIEDKKKDVIHSIPVEAHVAVQMAEQVLRQCYCAICLEALNEPPRMVPGPHASVYDLFQELFIHEVTWLTLPCCYQYMHTVCAVLTFMGKNRWICPYCKTVVVSDLYGPSGHVHIHKRRSCITSPTSRLTGESTSYAKVQSLRDTLMHDLPPVLGDEHLIPFLTMGTVTLAHPLS